MVEARAEHATLPCRQRLVIASYPRVCLSIALGITLALSGCSTTGGGNDAQDAADRRGADAASGGGCPDQGACSYPNSRRVPDVVGLRVPEACRALARNDYAGQIRDGVRSSTLEPGRVVSQNPRAGSKGGLALAVGLVVSTPYPAGALPPGSNCVDRRRG
jgi:hypothetical protein